MVGGEVCTPNLDGLALGTLLLVCVHDEGKEPRLTVACLADATWMFVLLLGCVSLETTHLGFLLELVNDALVDLAAQVQNVATEGGLASIWQDGSSGGAQ